eukprot:5524198-Prymnesium_polylepis.1
MPGNVPISTAPADHTAQGRASHAQRHAQIRRNPRPAKERWALLPPAHTATRPGERPIAENMHETRSPPP